MTEQLEMTERTRVRRIPKRANYERAVIYDILDEAFICHVGFTVDGKTFVIPTSYARVGDELLIHGSSASRMLRAMSGDLEVCVTVTLIDGLVLARSAFHHSMNYRSVVIFGRARIVDEEVEKYAALKAFTDHIVPDRWREIRPPNAIELKATLVLALPLDEASAKTRAGNPVDDEEDYEMDVWAGVIPLQQEFGCAVADDRLPKGIDVPAHVSGYSRGNE